MPKPDDTMKTEEKKANESSRPPGNAKPTSVGPAPIKKAS
jgi:hypothetical protein